MSRRRWTYTLGGVPLPEPIEVSEDFQSHAERQPLFTDRYMEGATTEGPSGTVDIGSRRKRAAYMQAHGLADYGDFAEHWKKKERERSTPRFSGDLGADIARAYETLSKRRK
jgi:hypothetical protein